MFVMNFNFDFFLLQTGSGKTYTMGTNYSGEDSAGGIIPQVMRTIFNRVQDFKDESSEFLIRVSFIEVKIYCLFSGFFLSHLR